MRKIRRIVYEYRYQRFLRRRPEHRQQELILIARIRRHHLRVALVDVRQRVRERPDALVGEGHDHRPGVLPDDAPEDVVVVLDLHRRDQQHGVRAPEHGAGAEVPGDGGLRGPGVQDVVAVDGEDVDVLAPHGLLLPDERLLVGGVGDPDVVVLARKDGVGTAHSKLVLDTLPEVLPP